MVELEKDRERVTARACGSDSSFSCLPPAAPVQSSLMDRSQALSQIGPGPVMLDRLFLSPCLQGPSTYSIVIAACSVARPSGRGAKIRGGVGGRR